MIKKIFKRQFNIALIIFSIIPNIDAMVFSVENKLLDRYSNNNISASSDLKILSDACKKFEMEIIYLNNQGIKNNNKNEEIIQQYCNYKKEYEEWKNKINPEIQSVRVNRANNQGIPSADKQGMQFILNKLKGMLKYFSLLTWNNSFDKTWKENLAKVDCLYKQYLKNEQKYEEYKKQLKEFMEECFKKNINIISNRKRANSDFSKKKPNNNYNSRKKTNSFSGKDSFKQPIIFTKQISAYMNIINDLIKETNKNSYTYFHDLDNKINFLNQLKNYYKQENKKKVDCDVNTEQNEKEEYEKIKNVFIKELNKEMEGLLPKVRKRSNSDSPKKHNNKNDTENNRQRSKSLTNIYQDNSEQFKIMQKYLKRINELSQMDNDWGYRIKYLHYLQEQYKQEKENCKNKIEGSKSVLKFPMNIYIKEHKLKIKEFNLYLKGQNKDFKIVKEYNYFNKIKLLNKILTIKNELDFSAVNQNLKQAKTFKDFFLALKPIFDKFDKKKDNNLYEMLKIDEYYRIRNKKTNNYYNYYKMFKGIITNKINLVTNNNYYLLIMLLEQDIIETIFSMQKEKEFKENSIANKLKWDIFQNNLPDKGGYNLEMLYKTIIHRYDSNSNSKIEKEIEKINKNILFQYRDKIKQDITIDNISNLKKIMKDNLNIFDNGNEHMKTVLKEMINFCDDGQIWLSQKADEVNMQSEKEKYLDKLKGIGFKNTNKNVIINNLRKINNKNVKSEINNILEDIQSAVELEQNA